MDGSQEGQRDDVDDVNSVHDPIQLGRIGAICLLLAEKDATFDVTSTTLHLLQMKGLYGGLTHEDPHEHMNFFKDICSPFPFKNVSK